MSNAAAANVEANEGRRRMPVAWLAGAAAALAVVGLATLGTTRAAFSSSTDNAGSTFKAGTVNLTDNDNGSVLFTMPSMVPGDSQTKCVTVTYAGVPASIKLYGAVTNDPAPALGSLAPYLTTTIEEGTGTAATGGASLSCTGFSPTSTLHGSGAGTTTLADFGTHTNFSNGIQLFGGPTGSSARSYRITVTLQDDNAAQGKDAKATFTWEAQNV